MVVAGVEGKEILTSQPRRVGWRPSDEVKGDGKERMKRGWDGTLWDLS